MAEWDYPWQDNNGDRMYSDADFRQYYSNMFTTGVIANMPDTYSSALQVKQMPNASMQVQVSAGAAFVNGGGYLNTSAKNITISPASSVQSRVDSIVLRFSISERHTYITYKQNDVNVIRSSDIYELQLCTINVPANAISIPQANITDKRADATVCGFSTVYGKVNVGDIEAQYQDMIITWFENIKNQLSEDQAVNLQNQIDEIHTVPTVDTIEDLNDLPAGTRYVSNAVAVLNSAYESDPYWVQTVYSEEDSNYKIQRAFPSLSADAQGAPVFRTQLDGEWTDWQGYI